MSNEPRLQFSQGTLLLSDKPTELKLTNFIWDERTLEWRAPAHTYRQAVLEFHQQKIPFKDEVRAYQQLDLSFVAPIVPREHQTTALTAWLENEGQGVVSLPTGSGKSILAIMAIAKVKRSTLVVVPTIDLMLQWQQVIQKCLGIEAGLLGGGYREIKDITVSTYDSAVISLEKIGNKFAFLIVDECHHLPSPQYKNIGLGMIAPYRMGLSATVERADGLESVIYQLLGKNVFDAPIGEMTGKYLAPYESLRVSVDLSEQERQDYDEAQETYMSFLKKQGIRMGTPRGWQDFVMRSARTIEGKQAMAAYRRRKNIALSAGAKFDVIWDLLLKHCNDQILIFTDDNRLAYRIGNEFVLPVITHQTKAAERKNLLDAFKQKRLGVLVTSKVLNEGVDVPAANIAIIASGSGGVREHVQRLGRILRYENGKKSLLYEVVTAKTTESQISRRRREHHAYQKNA